MLHEAKAFFTDWWYIRVPPNLIVEAEHGPECSRVAFLPRPTQPSGLSFFRADCAGPLSLIQDLITKARPDLLLKWGVTEDGDRETQAVNFGWRVAALHSSCFPSDIFRFTDRREDGHHNLKTVEANPQNAGKAKELFESYADGLAQRAVVLTRDECLLPSSVEGSILHAHLLGDRQ